MNANTGRAIGGLDHLYQSIGQILTTPRGSRLQRRGFGSPLLELVDAPNNLATRLRVYAGIATALMRQEPRLQLRRVGLSEITSSGSAVFDIEGVADATGQAIATRVRVFSAIATALMRQEPRLQLRRVGLADVTSSGSVVFDIEGVADASGEAIATSVAVPVRGQA